MLALLVLRLCLLGAGRGLLLADSSLLQYDIVEDVEVLEVLRGLLLSLQDVLFLIFDQDRVLRNAHVGHHMRLVLAVLVCLASRLDPAVNVLVVQSLKLRLAIRVVELVISLLIWNDGHLLRY